MKLFYNTNGFAHHRLEDVVELLAEIGYRGIALTPDVPHLDPRTATTGELREFRRRCSAAGLEITVESGARFVLDARAKHEPNLCSASGHERRVDYYLRLLEYARELEAPALSLWSGIASESSGSTLERLASRLAPVLSRARSLGVVVSLEPEPGMFVETIDQYRELARLVGPELRLTIDVGHLVVSETPPWAAYLSESAKDLAVVHLDDAIPGVHEHRRIGEGAVPWREIAQALHEIAFQGPLVVELSRDSHDAVRAARGAFERLTEFGF